MGSLQFAVPTSTIVGVQGNYKYRSGSVCTAHRAQGTLRTLTHTQCLTFSPNATPAFLSSSRIINTRTIPPKLNGSKLPQALTTAVTPHLLPHGARHARFTLHIIPLVTRSRVPCLRENSLLVQGDKPKRQWRR